MCFSRSHRRRSERHQSYPYVVSPTGAFVPIDAVRFHTYPIDFSVRYHWVNDTRWKPFVGVGVRYVAAPDVKAFGYQNHFGPEIVGGTAFQITKSLGVVADGKAYVGDHEPYDQPWKVGFGLAWRF